MASLPAVAGQSAFSGFEIDTLITTGELVGFATSRTAAEIRRRGAAG